MAIIDLNETPNIIVMTLRGNTGAFESSMNGSAQTIDRGGLKWGCVYTYTQARGDNRAELLANLAELRAQANRIRVPVYDNPNRGAYGGTPLVDGASQTGSSIAIKGGSNNITDWIKRGDYFSIDVNGEHELKMCTADGDTNGTGDIAALSFEPRLRASPLDNAAIWVEDGTLPKPKGIFLLRAPDAQWSSVPGQRSALSFDMIEDVFATQ